MTVSGLPTLVFAAFRSSSAASRNATDAGEAGSRTEVMALGAPPSRGDAERIEDQGGDSAERIVAYLSERKLV